MLGEPPSPKRDQKKGGRGRKREQREPEQPKLSKAKLQQVLSKTPIASVRQTVLRLAAGPCEDLDQSPAISVVWRLCLVKNLFQLLTFLKKIGVELWVGGRYTKYARNMPQTRWVAQGQRIGHSSVEEEICNAVLPVKKRKHKQKKIMQVSV